MKCYYAKFVAFAILFLCFNADAFSKGFPAKKNGKMTPDVALSSTVSDDAPPLKKSSPRKIGLFVEPTPFTHVSGYSNRFNELLRYLSKAGDEVEIVTTEKNVDKKDLPKERFGYKIHHTAGFIFSLYRQITLTLDLPDLKGYKMIEQFKPQIIHVTSPGMLAWAAICYARMKGIPVVASYHTHLPMYARNYLSNVPGIERFAWFLIKRLHSLVDLTLVTSPQMKEELVEKGVPRVDVWRKGIDTVRFDPKFKSQAMRERMTEGNPDDFLMVYVGRVGFEKRLKDIKPILERMPNARLCIVGKGPQLDDMKEYFKGTKTHFTGLLSGDTLSEAFASADAFIMPSDSETLGFVVLESMASGVPVVGAAAGGIPDLINDGETSFLVPTADTDAFVDRLTKLQNDKEFRSEMGRKARLEAERWGWEAATSVLRNNQYRRAIHNYHLLRGSLRGLVTSKEKWRLLFSRFFNSISQFFKRDATRTDAITP